MNILSIAIKSFRYYGSTNFAIALGVAAATAVLTGALIVGDSMRTSLRDLTLDRLGKIDEMLVSEGFFRANLASEAGNTDTFQNNYDQVSPAILFPGGTVETVLEDSPTDDQPSTRRSGQVTVLGINNQFGLFEKNATNKLDSANSNFSFPPSTDGFAPEAAIINQALADDLGITESSVDAGTAKITIRVPKKNQMPADSALGRKTDLIESLVDLDVTKIVPNKGLGRFGLFPSQADPFNVYVPIALLQDSLSRSVLKHKSDPNQANVLLFSGKNGVLPTESVSQSLRREVKPTLEDYGLTLKRAQQFVGKGENKELVFEYWSISSDKLVLTDETVRSIESAFPDARPVFTYLANDIRLANESSGVPFSMIAGVDFDQDYQLPITSDAPQPSATFTPALNDNEIVLNEWTADDLGAKVGDKVKITFFEPETTHGSQLERTSEFTVAAIAKLTQPDEPFTYRRRQGLEPAVFTQRPTLANDANLTPEVPGVTDAESIDDWNLPFETADKLRSQDDTYWEDFRTTPKGFVNLKIARELWHSRFGSTTNYRIPIDAGSREELTSKLLNQISQNDAKLGIHLVPIKRRGLEASSGSTPFDVLFLALSMFVIGSALILVSLLFRLGLQQRASEVGLMKAVGFDDKKLRRVWLVEMLVVSILGATVGLGLGVGYAALMIKGLSTWWVGAIARPFLTMHLSWISLSIGLLSGILICIATIAVSLWRTGKQPVTRLLHGELESSRPTGQQKSKRAWTGQAATWGLLLLAIGLTIAATQMSGEAQAGSFMGAGFLILALGLFSVYRWLKKPSDPAMVNRLSLSRLALLSTKRNPLRSTLTIGLVAVASFLIAAVSSFRLKPSDEGTAGFDWVAQSSQPIFDDLGSPAGRRLALGDDHPLTDTTEILSLRFKSGEDASCNNLYQSTQPRAIGVTPAFVNHFNDPESLDFAWAGSNATTEAELSNHWELLNGSTAHAGTKEDPIPVVLDKNTANYSLKIYMLGTVKEVIYDSGERIHVEVVGFLANTILQGSLIMSERDFVASFPSSAGYQYFLIDEGAGRSQDSSVNQPAVASKSVSALEEQLGDQGFDARSADKLLANFMSVQNTYLSTFQTLGALGLLLGTIGLAAVQIRSVLERKQELGLMRAVGFELPKLSRMIMLENAWLLITGLIVGVGSALFTTIPHWLVGSASVPWASLGVIFAVIAVVGLAAGWLASRKISQMPLLESLRM